MEKTFDIIRFFKNSSGKILIFKCITEEQKDEWCNSIHTHGDGWFDAFTDSSRNNFDCQTTKPMYPFYFPPEEINKHLKIRHKFI